MDLQPGDALGRYLVETRLGEGGMGCVVRALDTVLERRVAIKFLLPDRRHREEAFLRFHREARLAAQLTHGNVVRVYDIGDYDGVPFLVMEYVDGPSLVRYVGMKDVSVARKLRWLGEVARGLHAAHVAGLIHRDVKPANVMIGRDDIAKVVDFGLAKRQETSPALVKTFQTSAGWLVGTPSYMAPEQLEGDQYDARADQFSWGVMGYALFSGNNPRANDPRRERIPRLDELIPGVSRIASEVLERAYAYEPENRWPSLIEAAERLDLAAMRPSMTMTAVRGEPVKPRIVPPQRFCPACMSPLREEGQCERCSSPPPPNDKGATARMDAPTKRSQRDHFFERIAHPCPMAPLRAACFASRGKTALALGANGIGELDETWTTHGAHGWQRDVLAMRRGADGKTVVMVGKRGLVVSLAKAGSWAMLSAPTNDPDATHVTDVAFVDAQMVLVGEMMRGHGPRGFAIRMSTRGNTTIRSEIVPSTIAFATRRRVLYAAGQGKILRVDSSKMVVLHETGTDILAIAECGDDVFAVGAGGRAFRIDLAGEVHEEKVETSGTLLALAVSNDAIWASTSHGGIIRRVGDRWHLASDEETAGTGLIALYADGDRVTAIAVDGAIIRGHRI